MAVGLWDSSFKNAFHTLSYRFAAVILVILYSRGKGKELKDAEQGCIADTLTYYQKITDVYAECSADYDAKSESTKLFFKMVQNMMHLAVTHHTAAEIVFNRADAEQPHMGLTTWKKAPNGRVQKSDTIVAKNYLSDTELNQLNGITTSFLDLAETRAQRHIITTMEDWRKGSYNIVVFLTICISYANNCFTL